MKAVLLIALILGILFAGLPSPAAPARAEDPLLLEAEDLQVVLTGTVPDPEGIRLVLSCRNRTDRLNHPSSTRWTTPSRSASGGWRRMEMRRARRARPASATSSRRTD